MKQEAPSVNAYISLFPPKLRAPLKGKLLFKKHLDELNRFRIPQRIWLAFLTPPKSDAEKFIPARQRSIWALKSKVLQAFKEPTTYLNKISATHVTNDEVTLSLLEILYDLEEKKVLLPREQYEKWVEVADIYGLWKLRYALEDAVFETFDPENYALFESVVEKQMQLDKEFVASVRAILMHELKRKTLATCSIENRTKNIYGVYRKVQLKGKSINDIYDIHGFRIICDDADECYRAADSLHRLWPHFSDKYKDYIKEPKKNGYQSIHTVVKCLSGKPIEFQLRTHEMDAVASSGPANHAEYKKGQNLSSKGL